MNSFPLHQLLEVTGQSVELFFSWPPFATNPGTFDVTVARNLGQPGFLLFNMFFISSEQSEIETKTSK